MIALTSRLQETELQEFSKMSPILLQAALHHVFGGPAEIIENREEAVDQPEVSEK
jgi:hypothetical protein